MNMVMGCQLMDMANRLEVGGIIQYVLFLPTVGFERLQVIKMGGFFSL